MHVKFFRNKHEGVDNPLNTDNALKALEEEVNAYARQCRAQSMTLSPIESIGKWITIAVTFPCDPPSTERPRPREGSREAQAPARHPGAREHAQ